MDHLGAVRKQLHPGHTSSASKLLSITSGHCNQLLHLDGFSDSSRTSKLLMREIVRVYTNSPKVWGCQVLGSSDGCARDQHGKREGWSHPAAPALCHHPRPSLQLEGCTSLGFYAPHVTPCGWGVGLCRGGLCLYSHINWKCIKPVSYPGLCTYFISASYSALSQPQYFVFPVWKLIKKKLDHHEKLHFLKLAVVRKNSICFMSPQFQSVKSKFPSTQSIYFSSLFTLPVLHGIKLKCRKTFMGFLN